MNEEQRRDKFLTISQTNTDSSTISLCDYIRERGYHKTYLTILHNTINGLLSLQTFQGIQSLARHTFDFIFGWMNLPSFAYRKSYITSTMNLTRYRGYNDDMI